MLCYCHSGQGFGLCCQPLLTGVAAAKTCEALMRSRYSAYCSHDIDYIFSTYHHSKQQENSLAAIKQFADSCHFISLRVNSSEQTNSEGFVDFTVRYLQGNTLQQFNERSRFVYEQRWYYLDGILTDTPAMKISRNDKCPCGSGKKFKQCNEHTLSGQM